MSRLEWRADLARKKQTGSRRDAGDIANAVRKVCENINELRGLKHAAIERKGMSRAERPRIEKRQY